MPPSVKIEPYCSFCGKTKKEVKKLITGNNVQTSTIPPNICNECIIVGYQFITSSGKSTKIKKSANKAHTYTPEEIKEKLDDYIIGQDSAKETLCVAICNHYKRINNPILNGTEIQKSNIMLLGPSGSGKTLLVSTIAKILDLPFTIADSTSLTESGYSGNDVEVIFQRLLTDSKNDIEKAQKGIVFIDEIDKKTNKSAGSNHKDVSGEGVQQALLRLIEGDVVTLDNQKRSGGDNTIAFNTHNILFIVGGAFVGLEKIIEKRLQKGTSIGFGATMSKDEPHDVGDALELVEPDDLFSYGFIREFVGRFPITVAFHNIDIDMLEKILTQPKNCLISQYKELFKLDNIDLVFSPEYIRNVATKCYTRKVGARGLRSVVEKTLNSVQFILPRLKKEGISKIIVDGDGTIIKQ